jgi:hypothetical protein
LIDKEYAASVTVLYIKDIWIKRSLHQTELMDVCVKETEMEVVYTSYRVFSM